MWLKEGDKVAIVAPSGKVDFEKICTNALFLKNLKLEIIWGNHINNAFYGFAATDDERLADLQAAFDDMNCKAIFCARGGYGMTRIIDDLNWEKFARNPKIIVGYSDVTALLLEAEKRGFIAIHALNISQYHDPNAADSLEKLKNLLFFNQLNYKLDGHLLNCSGIVNAKLIGGNLSLLTRQIGTKSDFSTDGKILFLEDIAEPAYKIDGMMVQLKRAGKLNKLAGLMTGQFSEKPNDNYFPETSTEEIIARHTADFHYPKAFGLAFGHEMPALPLPLGCDMKFEVSKETVFLKLNDKQFDIL